MPCLSSPAAASASASTARCAEAAGNREQVEKIAGAGSGVQVCAGSRAERCRQAEMQCRQVAGRQSRGKIVVVGSRGRQQCRGQQCRNRGGRGRGHRQREVRQVVAGRYPCPTTHPPHPCLQNTSVSHAMPSSFFQNPTPKSFHLLLHYHTTQTVV